jgi:hypothetical protein
MTQTKEPTSETTAEELVKLDAEIESMEAQLEAGEKPLVWDEAGSVEEIAAEQHRLAILPRLITAAKIKRAELRIRRYEREAEPLEVQRTEAHEALERAQAKRFEVEEEIAAARQAWAYSHGRLQSLERRIKDAERELHELRGEA